jgi:hypothetical protein|tara:strand:+ start:55 stop:762 length:708 start_codon:yes stop_codon:yes gene_type:complete
MPQYSAMRGMLGESRLQQATGAQGLFWEKLQRGKSREFIRDWLNQRANEVATASGGLGLKNLLSKGVGLAAMALVPGGPVLKSLVGGLSSGVLSKILGDKEVGKLDTSGLDMSKILYGRPEAEQAEDTAQSAINRLIEGVDAQAVSTAFTTPLMYYTLKNTFGGVPTDGGGTMAGGVKSVLNPMSQEAINQAASAGLNYAQRSGAQYGTGGLIPMTSPVNVYADKPVSILDYLFR